MMECNLEGIYQQFDAPLRRFIAGRVVAGALAIARWRVLAVVITVLWLGAIACGLAYDGMIGIIERSTFDQHEGGVAMKHILSQWAITGILLLGAPFAAGAASLQQADEAGAAPYLPLIVIGIVLVFIVARQVFRRPAKPASLEPGQRRDYGLAGGAVCRSCGLPFARSALDLNMLAGKLVRCPHCGKWAILPAATPAALEAAEEKERQALGGAAAQAAAPQLSPEEQMRRRIENSKYE